MEIAKLSASKRTDQGKGPSRRLRTSGKIPAIAYGKNLAAMALAVDPKALKSALSGPHGRNSVVELAIDGGATLTAMVRQYSHHPVTREFLHADFLQVDLAQPVDVEVPFKLIGKSKGCLLYTSISGPPEPAALPLLGGPLGGHHQDLVDQLRDRERPWAHHAELLRLADQLFAAQTFEFLALHSRAP